MNTNMKIKKTTRIVTSALLAVGLTAAVAHAEPRWSRRPASQFASLDRNRDGLIERREWPYSTAEFRHLDDNRDGVLTARESGWVPTRNIRRGQLNREQYFRMLDRNRDGWLSPYEYDDNDYPFAWADTDRNGYLSWTEWRDSRIGKRGTPVWNRELGRIDSARLSEFYQLDRNEDEFLSRSEWRGSAWSFDRLDRDRDGFIYITEYLGG